MEQFRKCEALTRCQEKATMVVIHRSGPRSSWREYTCTTHGSDIVEDALATDKVVSSYPIDEYEQENKHG